jgi:hypothetical protein
MPELGNLEAGGYRARFQDDRGHWHTYNFDRDLLDILQ